MLLQGAIVLIFCVLLCAISYCVMRRFGRSRRQACRDIGLVIAVATSLTIVQTLLHIGPPASGLLMGISTPIFFLWHAREKRREAERSLARGEP